MIKQNLYIILFLISSCLSFSQTSPLLLIPVTEENGLSDNHVNCVLKDKQGFVWIGTEDGLNVMDGSVITHFKHKAEDTASISGNYIHAIKEDNNSNIWIGTENGLSCYHTKEKSFSNYYFTGSVYGGAINIVTDIAVSNKTVWVATDGGLIKLDAASGKHLLLLSGDSEPLAKRQACNKIMQMLQDADGTLWICTYDGLWSYSPSINQFKKRISAANDANYDPLITSVTNDDNKLWIGTWNKGLKLFDKASGVVTTYPYSQGVLTCVSAVRKMDGKLVIWLSGMLQAYDPVNKIFFNYKNVAKVPPDVRNIYTSADGWLWLCTNSGLFICNLQKQTFTNTTFSKDLTSQGIVFANPDHGFLMGAEGENILKKYDAHFNEVANYQNLIFRNYHGNRNIDALSMNVENAQSWWIGTSNGIVHINPIASTSKWFVHHDNDSTSLPVNFITYLFTDKENILWIFPWREGVWQMNKLTGKCTQLIDGLSKSAGVIKKLVIADAAEDDAGNLWMADIDEGIIFYDRLNNRFSKPFNKVIGDAPRTFRIYKQGGYFYSVANTTLLKWKDREHYTAIHFPAEMEKYIYDFAPDKQSGWWFATRNGLVYFNEKKNIFKRFTTSDGLYTNDLSTTLFCKQDGEMIVGGNNFLTTFFPEQIIASSSVMPQLLLTKFMANGNSIAINEQKTVDLSYNNNNIFISWSLPDYTSPFKNQYYCKLQGIDSGWRYVGNKGEVQYASLSPGNYTILLKATSANGDNSKQDLKINFIIHLPFWRTAWFFIVVALVLGSILYFIISKRISGIKAKAAMQQQLSELEMKALRAQMNPHFIFNSLNSIQECIVMNNTTAAYDYLSKFSKLVRRILENSGKLFVSLKEEMELLQWYVDLEQLRFKEPVIFSMDSETGINADNIMVPSMIVQPYVENALWHGLARKEGKKMLSVKFTQKHEGIECTIEDNGIGRHATATPAAGNYKKSMGMMITKERLELFNKKARIETHDLLDKNGNARGTKIVIYLPAE